MKKLSKTFKNCVINPELSVINSELTVLLVIEILVVVATIFVTRAITINEYKDAQRTALFNSMTEEMTECKARAAVPAQCTYEVTYEGDVITNIEVIYHGL